MVTFQRTACVKSGMMPEAVAMAREFVALIEKLTGDKARVQLPIGGNPWRIRWTIEYADLNSMQHNSLKLMADPDYQELLAKIANCVISGASDDEVWV